MALCETQKRSPRIATQAAQSARPGEASSMETPIWEVLYQMGEAMPAEEAAMLPSDLAQNLDHYLYGAPRQQPRGAILSLCAEMRKPEEATGGVGA